MIPMVSHNIAIVIVVVTFMIATMMLMLMMIIMIIVAPTTTIIAEVTINTITCGRVAYLSPSRVFTFLLQNGNACTRYV